MTYLITNSQVQSYYNLTDLDTVERNRDTLTITSPIKSDTELLLYLEIEVVKSSKEGATPSSLRGSVGLTSRYNKLLKIPLHTFQHGIYDQAYLPWNAVFGDCLLATKQFADNLYKLIGNNAPV